MSEPPFHLNEIFFRAAAVIFYSSSRAILVMQHSTLSKSSTSGKKNGPIPESRWERGQNITMQREGD